MSELYANVQFTASNPDGRLLSLAEIAEQGRRRNVCANSYCDHRGEDVSDNLYDWLGCSFSSANCSAYVIHP